MSGRRGTFWLLSLPAFLWLAAFFLAPLVLMVLFSFRTETRLSGDWSLSFHHYNNLLAAGSYWRLLAVSAGMAMIVAAAATALSYPVAYFLTFRAGPRAGLYLVLLLIPFWTSYLLRVMAWKFMLGPAGVINSFLLYVGLIEAPLRFLLYSRVAVVLTLIYVWIPFVALPILAAMQRIEPALLEAAADLGANPFLRFLRVTLPLSLPGVVAGFFMVFIPTVGEYVTPLLVGGSRGSMYGNIIQDFFTKAANWPFGSALSVVMLIGTLLLIGLATRLVDVNELLEQ